MKHNPCLDCRLRDEDKNNNRCLECQKRVDYVHQLELKLNFSRSYTNTGLYERHYYPLESKLAGRLKMSLSR